MAVGVPIGAVAGAPVRARGRKVPVAIGLVLAVLVAAAAYGGVWLFGPRALYGAGDLETAPGTPGRTTYFGGIVNPASAAVVLNLRSVTPVVSRNTSRARVRIDVCHHAANVGGIGAGGPAMARSVCHPLLPFRPGDYRLGARDQFVVAITPRRAGVVHIAKFAVTYRQGMRYGRQYTGVAVTVRS